MKRELQEALIEEFPFMGPRKPFLSGWSGPQVEEEHPGVLEHTPADGGKPYAYELFGIETGDGWYELLRGLCREITEAYERVGRPVDLIPIQVKEKYGTLRFYWYVPDWSPGVHAIDFPDGGSLRVRPERSDFLEELDRIVAKWEDYSEEICEECGRAGKLRPDLGWISTLCEEHYRERTCGGPGHQTMIVP